jgi:hypothetical protein
MDASTVWHDQGHTECVEDACTTLFFAEMGRLDELDVGELMIRECNVERRN